MKENWDDQDQPLNIEDSQERVLISLVVSSKYATD